MTGKLFKKNGIKEMDRYKIALKKPVPKRRFKKFLFKLKYWREVISAKLQLMLKRVPTIIRNRRNPPRTQGLPGIQGYTG
jgi:hypothetical protein